jgi:hypothetical protein
MKALKRSIVGLGLAATFGLSGAATIQTPDGLYNNFGGFDWTSAASVLISGYTITSASPAFSSQVIDVYYNAFATAIQDANGNNYVTPTLIQGTGNGSASGYEITIVAHLQETVQCISAPPGCTFVTITPNSGVWNVFLDTTPDAKLSNQTGFGDGVNLLSGTFNGGQAAAGPQGASNPGNVVLATEFDGQVSSTNLAYINPALTGTSVVSTLQFGTKTTAWAAPTSWLGNGLGGAPAGSFVGQADANQSFSVTVPEPASLALTGIALAGMGLLARRRKQA